ncbi:MAG: hypothetical protein IJV36_02130 [Prevotella sp.]|nr:hypothetical protein [Prevotella sp.]
MQVKCPKCRFRYDTPVAAGITEAACVCPRCGSPFVYAVTGAGSSTAELAEEAASTSQQAVATEAKAENGSLKYATPIPPNSSKISQNPTKSQNNSRIILPNPSQPLQKGRSRGCLRNCLIVFLVLFIAAVIAVRNCYGDRSYTQMMLENGASESLDEFGDGSVVNDYEDFIVEGAEKAPEWLQGTWRIDTETGAVVIVIRGKQIAEESGGEISRGTYYYKKKKLYCKFRESDEVEIRRVNTKRQTIVYDNRDMEKQ